MNENYLKKLSQIFETIFFLCKTSFIVKYRNSFLGYFWSLVNPLVFGLIYFIVFSIYLRIDIINYAVFLITGFFPWIFLSNCLISSSQSFTNNPTLIKKIRTRKIIFPVSNAIFETLHFCITLPIIFLFIYISNLNFFFSWIWQIPFMIVLQLIFLFPFVIIFSILNVYFRDTSSILSIFIQVMFFLSPILYPISKIPEKFLYYYNFNPIVYFIDSWRSILLDGNLVFINVIILLLLGCFFSILAFYIYKKFNNKIPEII